MGEDGPESVPSTVQKHPQITAVDLKFAADLIFILLVEENSAKQLAIFLAHLIQDPPDQFAAQAAVQLTFRPGARIDNVGRIFGHLRLPGVGTEEFERYVVADGMNETRQARGIVEGLAGTEITDDTQEGLLRRVLNKIR